MWTTLNVVKSPKYTQFPFYPLVRSLRETKTKETTASFLAAHVYLARISPALRSPTGHESFEDLASHMRHHPPTLVVYLLGVLGTTFHLANGVYTASFIHGLAASPQAQRRMRAISVALFLLLLGIGWGAVAGLFEAGRRFLPPVG